MSTFDIVKLYANQNKSNGTMEITANESVAEGFKSREDAYNYLSHFKKIKNDDYNNSSVIYRVIIHEKRI